MIDAEELEALIKEEGDFLPVEHEGYEGMCLRMVDGVDNNINGFVKIPEGHKLHGIDCDGDTFPNFFVYGGITFSQNYNPKTGKNGEWWIGFDTAHNGDYVPYHTHLDGEEYGDMQYVENEIINIINQLIEIEQKKMKRYNQGFKYFGPMEQCKDGGWVRHEDAEKEFDNLKSIYLAGQELKECRHKKELNKIKSNCNWIALAALLISVFNITEFLLR